jgi:hypothetical protein
VTKVRIFGERAIELFLRQPQRRRFRVVLDMNTHHRVWDWQIDGMLTGTGMAAAPLCATQTMKPRGSWC